MTLDASEQSPRITKRRPERDGPTKSVGNKTRPSSNVTVSPAFKREQNGPGFIPDC